MLWKKAVAEARSHPSMPADKRRRNFLGELIAPVEPGRRPEKPEASRLLVRGPRDAERAGEEGEAEGDAEPGLDLGFSPEPDPEA